MRRVVLEAQRRGKVIAYGGLALAHKLLHRLGLPDAIDRELTLLKLHLPYHESDHVLTHTYNIFAGGTCIEDIASLQDSEAFRNLTGACRVPDPTTAGDFLRRFDAHSLGVMDNVLDEQRSRIWKMLPRRMRRCATVDLDSRWTSGRSRASIRRWRMSGSRATSASDACCTITSHGARRPRWRVTTTRQRMWD